MPAASADLSRLILALPPGRRHAFYTASTAGRARAVPLWTRSSLTRSPQRVADVARRMAERHGAGQAWESVLLAESFLPVAEVRDRLVEATRRAAAEDRALAWPLLIRNAARSGDPAQVTAVLEELARLATSRTRCAPALSALSETRPALFTADAEPFLDRISADAVAARDSSYDTRGALSHLALSVLREHAAGG